MSDPSDTAPPDCRRRAALTLTCAVGGVGAVAVAVPFAGSWWPSERAKAAGAPVEVDISDVAAGEKKIVEWRGKPVWILHRTPAMIESVKRAESKVADPLSKRTVFAETPSYARNALRSIKPEYFIGIGICSHLGCNPIGPFPSGAGGPLGNDPGFVCPCHGSTFDLAGRVYKNKPAPDNLEVPPYKFLSDAVVLIGEDNKS